jgi:hypothetical protein
MLAMLFVHVVSLSRLLRALIVVIRRHNNRITMRVKNGSPSSIDPSAARAPGHAAACGGTVEAWRRTTLRNLLDHASARAVGLFRDESAAIAFLRDRLVAILKPRTIWLFGSRARGDAREDSDFDLLVVLPDGLPLDAMIVRGSPNRW